MAATVTVFVLGVSAAVAAMGIASPEFFETALQILLVIMMGMGGAYLAMNRGKGDVESAAPFSLPRMVAIRIMWGQRQHQMVWAVA